MAPDHKWRIDIVHSAMTTLDGLSTIATGGRGDLGLAVRPPQFLFR